MIYCFSGARTDPPALEFANSLANDEVKYEMTAGWVFVLLAMKAAVDFGIDLRIHNIDRVWDNGYCITSMPGYSLRMNFFMRIGDDSFLFLVLKLVH